MITYYAKALNAAGQIEQMLVTKEPGRVSVPQWTGKTYKTDAAADRDLIALNSAIAKQRGSFKRMIGE